MNRMIGLPALFVFACLTTTIGAAEMTFRLVNDTERTLNLKLFSNGESHQQWPSKTRAYSVKPDLAVQTLGISCREGEQICWGAWMTVQAVSGQIGAGGRRDTQTYKYQWGAGERGMRSCSQCCQVCEDGAKTRVMKLQDALGINAK